MDIKILDKNGITLKTAGKYCPEDIKVTVDDSLLGSGGGGTEDYGELIKFNIVFRNPIGMSDGYLHCVCSPCAIDENGEVYVENDDNYAKIANPKDYNIWGNEGAIPSQWDGWYSVSVFRGEATVAVLTVPKDRPVILEMNGDMRGLPSYSMCEEGTVLETDIVYSIGRRFIVFWDPETVSDSVTFTLYELGSGGSN